MLKNPKLLKEQNYINGQWCGAESGETFDVLNPFNGEKIASVPRCGSAEAKLAIASADEAFQSFSQMPPVQRAALIDRWADLIDQNIDDLATIMTLEQGKPIQESRGEYVYANSFNRWFSGEARRIYGETIPADDPNCRYLVVRQPVGVTAAITPWNFPSSMITRKCAPAFAAGCTFVCKPAEDTPLSALALAVLAEEAGFPPGVFNVITGIPNDIGLELTQNPLVKKFSFTGSTAVGKKLMAQTASTVKKVSMELGGNAPFIVFEDADLESAAEGLITCKYRNSGQTCVCANRIYIQESILDEFLGHFKAKVEALKVGDGMLGPDIGPLINKAAFNKVSGLIQDAKAKGAKVLYGGDKDSAGDLCITPTILTGINQNMDISSEEIFGPVAAIQVFKDEADVIQKANDTKFGLASYFYSRDIGRIWRVSEALEYGMVGANAGIISNTLAPFGGVKESGLGREGSKYGIDEFTVVKYICMGDIQK